MLLKLLIHVQARYLLSPDKDLRKVGGVTGIKWFEDFLFYKSLLLPNTKKGRDIFKFFNDYVFGSEKIAHSGLGATSKNDEDFEDAMRAILDEEDSADENDSSEAPHEIADDNPDENNNNNSRPQTPPHSPTTILAELPSPAALSGPSQSVRLRSSPPTEPDDEIRGAETNDVDADATDEDTELYKKKKKSKAAAKGAKAATRTATRK